MRPPSKGVNPTSALEGREGVGGSDVGPALAAGLSPAPRPCPGASGCGSPFPRLLGTAPACAAGRPASSAARAAGMDRVKVDRRVASTPATGPSTDLPSKRRAWQQAQSQGCMAPPWKPGRPSRRRRRPPARETASLPARPRVIWAGSLQPLYRDRAMCPHRASRADVDPLQVAHSVAVAELGQHLDDGNPAHPAADLALHDQGRPGDDQVAQARRVERDDPSGGVIGRGHARQGRAARSREQEGNIC